MKLRDLFEKLTADVHINADKTLYVITSLIEKTFGADFKKISGGCLASQMIFSMAAASKIKPNELIDYLNFEGLSGNFNGVTLDSLYKIFHNQPIRVDDEILTFQLSVQTPTLDKAIKEVKSGQPIIFIPSNELWDALEDHDPRTGIAKITDDVMGHNLKNVPTAFHSYLLVGYDVSEKHLIFRDTRDRYAFSGYVKASIAMLKKNKKAYKFITVVVDSVKRKHEPLEDYSARSLSK